MSKAVTTIRWSVRLLGLGAAVFFAVGGPVPYFLARLFPGLSPFVAGMSTLAQRRWYMGVFWAAPAIVVLAMGIWKGRLFCRWICPSGTLQALPSRLSLGRKILRVRLGGYVFWIVLVAALVGAPLLGFLDPLSTFSRVTVMWRGPVSPAAIVSGLILPLMLILGAVQPLIWCTHLCPLGYLFDFSLSLRSLGATKTLDRTRRKIILGVFLGLPAAGLVRKYAFASGDARRRVALPPGAKDPKTFASACTRCYACVNVCPTGIIHVGNPLAQKLGELFQPEVGYFQDEDRPDFGFCSEPCMKCSQVCPAGALSPLTLRQKRQRKIGTAEIDRPKCLSWTDKKYCMVCQEYCPYRAIDTDFDGDLPRPVVKEDTCRGCGFCHHACPAIREGKAIIVRGVDQQSHIDDDYADLVEE